jgi:hypothetical protein
MAMNIRHESQDESFDNAMRELHAQALMHVSPMTRGRLRVGRTAPQRAPIRGFGWVLASGFAAVFAIAIGLQLQKPPATTVSTQTAASTTPDSSADDVTGLVATLDENPDFYLWLASNDDTLPVALER